ncbi:MAG TPA: hypothetical protein VHN18_13825 [Micromonosporaceae bacterium]|nr:hypothetical protein [Micromonosporaceae bacterium]
MTLSVPAPRQALTDPPIPRGYVLHLQTRLLEAEAALLAMNEKYDQVKARFDRSYARQGITPETDIVTYINVKIQNPELRYWYSKVEHFQREVAAYGAALTGLEAGHRMLAAAGHRPAAANGRVQESRRRALYPASSRP